MAKIPKYDHKNVKSYCCFRERSFIARWMKMDSVSNLAHSARYCTRECFFVARWMEMDIQFEVLTIQIIPKTCEMPHCARST